MPLSSDAFLKSYRLIWISSGTYKTIQTHLFFLIFWVKSFITFVKTGKNKFRDLSTRKKHDQLIVD